MLITQNDAVEEVCMECRFVHYQQILTSPLEHPFAVQNPAHSIFHISIATPTQSRQYSSYLRMITRRVVVLTFGLQAGQEVGRRVRNATFEAGAVTR